VKAIPYCDIFNDRPLVILIDFFLITSQGSDAGQMCSQFSLLVRRVQIKRESVHAKAFGEAGKVKVLIYVVVAFADHLPVLAKFSLLATETDKI
jgi:hypothetical protein